MTNLLEKALLTGFGIFILLIFVSLINPFMISISEFNSTIKNDVEKYNNFFNEVDTAILFVIENPDVIYLDVIEYEEYTEDGFDIVTVEANGKTFLVNMTFTAFHEWMTQEAEDYKMNQL